MFCQMFFRLPEREFHIGTQDHLAREAYDRIRRGDDRPDLIGAE